MQTKQRALAALEQFARGIPHEGLAGGVQVLHRRLAVDAPEQEAR